MNDVSYYNSRRYSPDEIGGFHRTLTGEEVDAWRVWLSGGQLTRRQRFVVQELTVERMRFPAASVPVQPVNVQVNVNTGQESNRATSSDGTLFILSVFVLVFILIGAVGVVWMFAGWMYDRLPWSYLLVITPVIAGVYITKILNARLYESPFV